MSKELPFMPLWVAQLMSDRKVQLMTAEEFGAYMALLCNQWLDGSLPVDDAKLAILSKSGARWGEVRDTVLDCFTVDGDAMQNHTLEKIRTEQLSRRNKYVKAGRHGANARWSKPQCDRNGDAIQTPMRLDSISDQEPESDSDLEPTTGISSLRFFTALKDSAEFEVAGITTPKQISDAASRAGCSVERFVAKVIDTVSNPRVRKPIGAAINGLKKNQGPSDAAMARVKSALQKIERE